jgi:hypothetical protein
MPRPPKVKNIATAKADIKRDIGWCAKRTTQYLLRKVATAIDLEINLLH